MWHGILQHNLMLLWNTWPSTIRYVHERYARTRACQWLCVWALNMASKTGCGDGYEKPEYIHKAERASTQKSALGCRTKASQIQYKRVELDTQTTSDSETRNSPFWLVCNCALQCCGEFPCWVGPTWEAPSKYRNSALLRQIEQRQLSRVSLQTKAFMIALWRKIVVVSA